MPATRPAMTKRPRPSLTPLEFARQVCGADPAPYQADVLNALTTHRRVAVRGPHGLGKTAMASWVVLWGLCTFGDDAKIITTASVWRQISRFLWPEIRKWAARAKWPNDRAPEILQESARLGRAEAFAVASDNPAYIEGAHSSTSLLYVLDEAKAIPPATWDAIEGAFSTGTCYVLAISTPGDRSGRFYDIHRRAAGYEDWWVRHVTLAEALASGRISADWVEARRRQWGESSPVFQARVLGEFPEQGDDALISLAWVEAAIERGNVMDPSDTGERQAGQDVARYGSDDSANALRVGSVVTRLETWSGNDTMQTTGRATQIARDHRARLAVDVVGVGAGVYDRLREMGVNATAVNVGEAARDKERFANLRAELFWNVREMLQNGDIAFAPDLPRELLDRLTGELTALKFKINSRGQILLVSKDEMRAAGLPSPDLADALALAFAPAEMYAPSAYAGMA